MTLSLHVEFSVETYEKSAVFINSYSFRISMDGIVQPSCDLCLLKDKVIGWPFGEVLK